MTRNENRKILWPILVALGLITANFIGAKYTTLATNIELSNALVIYPLTYLFILLIARTFDSKFAKKTVYMAAIAQVLFIVGLMVVSMLRSNEASAYDRAYIEYLFTPNNFKALGLTIAYPNLLYYGFSIVGFVLGHLIAIKLYKATENITPKAFAFGIGYFLSFIIDTIVFIGGYNCLQMLIDEKFKLVTLVRKLTGQFIGLFVAGIILIIIFSIYNMILKKGDKKDSENDNQTAPEQTNVIAPVVNAIGDSIEIKPIVTEQPNIEFNPNPTPNVQQPETEIKMQIDDLPSLK